MLYKDFGGFFPITGILHVSYAPEYETLADAREKFAIRKKNVAGRIKALRRSVADDGEDEHEVTEAKSQRQES